MEHVELNFVLRISNKYQLTL